MTPVTLLVSVAAGYAIGSVPVAYLVARARGINIFAVGTGNPGAANTFRSVGRGAGLFVFAADAARGAAAVGIAAALSVEPAELRVLAGAAAVAGHWYPIFLRFRGGAGLAPAVGIALATLPVAALIGMVPAGMLLLRFHNTAYAAVAGFTVFFLIGLIIGQPTAALAVVLMAALVVLHTRFVYERFTVEHRRSRS